MSVALAFGGGGGVLGPTDMTLYAITDKISDIKIGHGLSLTNTRAKGYFQSLRVSLALVPSQLKDTSNVNMIQVKELL